MLIGSNLMWVGLVEGTQDFVEEVGFLGITREDLTIFFREIQ